MRKLGKYELIKASVISTGALFGARHILEGLIEVTPESIDEFLINSNRALVCLNILVTLPVIRHGIKQLKYTANRKYLLEKYDEYIKSIAEFLKEMDMANNPVEVYTGLIQMIFEGALSKDKKFSVTGDYYDYIKRGISVMTGSGACRHLAPLLTDVFNCLGFEAVNLNGYLTTDFKRKTTFTKKELKNLNLRVMNHVVCIAKMDDKAIIFDPMNLGILSNKLHDNIILNADGSQLFVYKGWPVSWELEKPNDDDVRYKLLNMPLLSLGEYNQYFEPSVSKAFAVSSRCNHFYKENKELYEEVSETALHPRLIYKKQKNR